MIFLMVSSRSTMFETSSEVAVGVSEILKSMVSSFSKVTSRSFARSLRQSAAGQGMESASGSILKFCNSSIDCVSRPSASICSIEIMPAGIGDMIVAARCGAADAAGASPGAAGAAAAAAAAFSSPRSAERFSEENALRRICSTSSGFMPSSRALPPSWKLASMKVQPSSLAASPTLKSSLFSSAGLYFVLRNRLMTFLALSMLTSLPFLFQDKFI